MGNVMNVLRFGTVLTGIAIFGLASATAAAATVIYVVDDATVGGDGLSWPTAFNDLQLALATAEAGDDIWVAAGNYKPDGGTGDRYLSFELPDQVKLYGGFAGNESSLEERRGLFDRTILSGDLNGNDGSSFQNHAENSLHVVRIDSFNTATLDGFVIRGGEGDIGAGILCGGSVFFTLRNSIIRENRAYFGPGNGHGGGLFSGNSTLQIDNCVFAENMAADDGAGIFTGGPTEIRNSLFLGNLAPQHADAAGVHAQGASASVRLTGCVFAQNFSQNGAAAIKVFGGARAFLSNCIAWNNGSSPIVALVGSNVTAEFSNIEGGWAGVGNSDSNPLFVSPGYWNNNGTPNEYLDDVWADGDYRLLPSSPCINAGDPAHVFIPGVHDLDGHARVLCGRVDMGAYEFGIGDYDCDRDVSLFDYASWANCYTGPDVGPFDAGCEALDFDGDLDVDWADFAGMQVALGAP